MINVMHHDEVPPRPMVAFYAALAKPPVTVQGPGLRALCRGRAWGDGGAGGRRVRTARP
jgi:hypothetical protein